jgi:hypothetical protein
MALILLPIDLKPAAQAMRRGARVMPARSSALVAVLRRRRRAALRVKEML